MTDITPAQVLIIGGPDISREIQLALSCMDVNCVQVSTPSEAIDIIEPQFSKEELEELVVRPLPSFDEVLLPEAEYHRGRQVPTMRQRIKSK
jgi:hypothetical protein